MTRNLYLGASLDPVIAAPTPVDLSVRGAEVWGRVQRSDIPDRARLLAAEIAAVQPLLVGLQEASLWRVRNGETGTPDAGAATRVVHDLLALLLDALAARGEHYEVVTGIENFDAEVHTAEGIGVRLTDRDVVLARSGTLTRNVTSGWYRARMPLTLGGPGGMPVEIPRGWNSVEAEVHGHWVRFVNTHLEVDAPAYAPTQVDQTRELIEMLDRETLPTILLGDINSAADGSSTPSYRLLREAGFEDAWERAHPGDGGHTFGHAEDLRNPEPVLSKRIDFILTRGPIEVRDAFVVGANPEARTAAGLWPSDHLGVVSTLQLRPKRQP
ncbi:MAG TPA: endonuclease/exonuclease/phosphatase family protein [Gemmatimonadaceae bacterium]|nr:endonuclease/exonuclease/phosphatase family protein [Gemmatimonadaceae bacterium]